MTTVLGCVSFTRAPMSFRTELYRIVYLLLFDYDHDHSSCMAWHGSDVVYFPTGIESVHLFLSVCAPSVHT